MHIIVGLGNPGKDYKGNRHNAGFMFLDKMAGEGKFSQNKKFEAEIFQSEHLMLVKPLTFMNESGRSVRKILDFYRMDVSSLILVHDDLDLELGLYKIQNGVGPKVHNGVNSVEETLKTKDFLRVRLGIDNRKNLPTELGGADYVLGNFSKEEKDILLKTIDKSLADLLLTLSL